MPSANLGCNDIFKPPRPGSASAGGFTSRLNAPSTCTSVACCTVNGTAGMMRWRALSASRAPLIVSLASISQRIASCRVNASCAGAVTIHATSRASPAGISTVCGLSSSSVARGATSTFIAALVVLRNVICARYWSSSRTSGGKPLMICKSCVALIVVCPVPNKPVAASATATILNVVSASFSGTLTTAWPCASSCTRGFQSSSVSSSSRVPLRPPPPPAATALRP